MNEQVNNGWVDILEKLPPSRTQVQVSYKAVNDNIYCDRFAFCLPTGEWFYLNQATGEIEDIDCINTINKYITDGTSILNYYNIGEIYVLIFGADSFDSDLENYEYLTVKTASKVIKYNTQKIMDIITIMSKEEIETEDN